MVAVLALALRRRGERKERKKASSEFAVGNKNGKRKQGKKHKKGEELESPIF